MWNNLFISYELKSSEQDQDKINKAIQSLGNSTQLHTTCWYVNSPKNATEAASLVGSFFDDDDVLVVANTSTDSATWKISKKSGKSALLKIGKDRFVFPTR
ncbi:MAG: hypothetical protein ABW170_04715 [Candidatus Thiodiazotropha sp. L084R]